MPEPVARRPRSMSESGGESSSPFEPPFDRFSGMVNHRGVDRLCGLDDVGRRIGSCLDGRSLGRHCWPASRWNSRCGALAGTPTGNIAAWRI